MNNDPKPPASNTLTRFLLGKRLRNFVLVPKANCRTLKRCKIKCQKMDVFSSSKLPSTAAKSLDPVKPKLEREVRWRDGAAAAEGGSFAHPR